MYYTESAAAAKSLQSCSTLCDPRDGSPPGSPVLGILQARTLEWVAISFSNAWKWKVKGKSLSRVWLLATPWTTAYQAPASMGFSRQKCWSGGAIAFSNMYQLPAIKSFNSGTKITRPKNELSRSVTCPGDSAATPVQESRSTSMETSHIDRTYF